LKVLFLGPYKDGTEQSRLSTETILAMDSVGIDVVPRDIPTLTKQVPIPDRLKELEVKSSQGADILYYNVIPPLITHNRKFKKIIANISTDVTITDTSLWPNYLKLVDEIWCSTQFTKADLLKHCAEPNKVKVMYPPINTTIFERSYEPTNIPELKDKFVFYNIDTYGSMSNMETLIKAFILAFQHQESAALVLKCNIMDKSPQEIGQILQNKIAEIIKKTQLPPTNKNIIIMPQIKPDEDMMPIHKMGDCFVDVSCGSQWPYRLLEAMGMGNLCIYPDIPNMYDCATDIGLPIKTFESYCYDFVDMNPSLYTSNNKCHQVHLSNLITNLQAVYSEGKNCRPKQREKGKSIVYNYSYELIGQRIKEALCTE
jgi:hypothetical protein